LIFSAFSAVPAVFFKPLKSGKILRMIDKELLEILVCPVCKKPLELKNNGQSLKCGECRRVYPIRDNIPIMLVDEATLDPS
jgi:uncharacterized protein YbaR (Trm112 family)